jgi:hypothetical protein
VGLKTSTKIKYTIYSIIILSTSGIYFLLAYKGYASQTIDIKTLNKFTGTVIERGTANRKSGRRVSRVFFVKIDGLRETLGIYRKEGNYSGLVGQIQPGDTVTVFYLGTSTDESINIDLVQLEKDGQVIVDEQEFKEKESFLIYIGLIAGLFTVGFSVWYYNKHVRLLR